MYAVSMLFAGRIIDRLGTKTGYAVAIIVWSLAAIVHIYAIPMGQALVSILGIVGITGFSVSVLGFMAARALLGIGEAGNFPAAIKAAAEYFPKQERSFATGIFNSGTTIGAILAPLTVPLIRIAWGWEAAFVVMGLLGFVWLFFWKVLYEKPEEQTRMSLEELSYIKSGEEELSAQQNQERVGWFKLLRYKQTWAFAIGKLLTDGVWWFFLFWLPAYLKAQYGIVDKAVMLPLFVLYSMTMIGSIGGGWFPMYFINKGHKVYDARMKAMFIIALFPLVILAAQPLGSISFWMPVLLIGIGASAHQAWSANIFTTVSDMFPKKAVASVVGIGGMAGGLGGVVVSKIGGALFDHYKKLGHIETGYTIMFSFCAVAYLIAWLIMKSLVPKYKPVDL
jgi:ACS family hexuronate transporter-like MFS transporter